MKALERKREIKLQKHKQYEDECRKKRQENIKEVPLIQHASGIVGGAVPIQEPPKEQPKEEPKEHAVQPKEEPKKKKTVKKIIKYVEESDDDDAEEIEEVIVKKNNKIKAVPQQVKQPENQYSDLLYNSGPRQPGITLKENTARAAWHFQQKCGDGNTRMTQTDGSSYAR